MKVWIWVLVVVVVVVALYLLLSGGSSTPAPSEEAAVQNEELVGSVQEVVGEEAGVNVEVEEVVQ